MLRNNYLRVLLTLCISASQAQEKLWEVNLKDKLYKVGWIEQTNYGFDTKGL